jgi:hypothetical protein
MHYQVYLRVRRGGTGIPYELARTEFLAVFGDAVLSVVCELPSRRRMWVDLSITQDAVAAIASDLGYTEAILHLEYERYADENLCQTDRGRWRTGWIREGEQKIRQTEVYVQDKAALLQDAPSNRMFEIQEQGQKRKAFGHRSHRAVSNLDARFLFNVVKAKPTDLIYDPFAGYGGFVEEARRRGLRIIASDIDSVLSPGLSSLAPDCFCLADARCLPLPSDHVDLILTEPPFRTAYRQSVLESVVELHRVLKPRGRLVLLVSADMREGVRIAVERSEGRVDLIDVIPRNGGMKCPLLIATF